MPDAPRPITSDPAHPWQPYDATAPGSGDAQTAAEGIYDAAGGPGGSEPWVKIREGGAANRGGASDGTWPGDGASGSGGWKQT